MKQEEFIQKYMEKAKEAYTIHNIDLWNTLFEPIYLEEITILSKQDFTTHHTEGEVDFIMSVFIAGFTKGLSHFQVLHENLGKRNIEVEIGGPLAKK